MTVNHPKRQRDRKKMNGYNESYRKKNVNKLKNSRKKYYQKNKELLKEKSAEYRRNNKELRCETLRKSRLKNKVRMREYYRNKIRERMINDIQFKISCRLRERLNKAIKGKYKKLSAVKGLGCSMEEFIKYFETLFSSGMNWGNHGKWHIDHKKPLSSFDLTTASQLEKACHYTNLQPLWAIDNLRKNDKYGIA